MKLHNLIINVLLIFGLIVGCSTGTTPEKAVTSSVAPSAAIAEVRKPSEIDPLYSKRLAALERLTTATKLAAATVTGTSIAQDAKFYADIIEQGCILAAPKAENGTISIIPVENRSTASSPGEVVIMPVLTEDGHPDIEKMRGNRLAFADMKERYIGVNNALMEQIGSDFLVGIVMLHEMIHLNGGDEAEAYLFEFAFLEMKGGKVYADFLEKEIARYDSDIKKSGTINPNLTYNKILDPLFDGPNKSEFEGLIRMNLVLTHAMVRLTIKQGNERKETPEQIKEAVYTTLRDLGVNHM